MTAAKYAANICLYNTSQEYIEKMSDTIMPVEKRATVPVLLSVPLTPSHTVPTFQVYMG